LIHVTITQTREDKMGKLKVVRVFFNTVNDKGVISKGKHGSQWAHAAWVLATSEKKAKEWVVGYKRDVDCETVDLNTISCDPAFTANEGVVMF